MSAASAVIEGQRRRISTCFIPSFGIPNTRHCQHPLDMTSARPSGYPRPQGLLTKIGGMGTGITVDERREREERAERLVRARIDAGFPSAVAAARRFRWNENTYKAHEQGRNGFGIDAARAYAAAFGIDVATLNFGTVALVKEPAAPTLQPTPVANAGKRVQVSLGEVRIPAYGQAMAGADGSFVLNGTRVTDVVAPPSLAGVLGAYAVYISGESMEPRYYAGEAVFVNPRMPVRRGDFVVIQIKIDEHEAPLGYVKRFVSMSDKTLVVEQFNPAKRMEFKRDSVESVHRIIMGGDG